MRSFNARLTVPAVLAMALVAGGGAVPMGAAWAQSATAGKSAQEVLQTGLAAQKARNHAAAVSYFSRAINMGGLARKQMTYALYRRAISNRAQKQSAQAISDLNSALFFKGDLSSRDRADAIEERMKAFKDAGLAPTSVPTASSASQWGATASAPTPVYQASKRRVISTAPRRVLEPIKVVRPTRLSSALPPGSPTLTPATPQPKARAVARREISAFQTRVAAAPVRPKPQPTQSSSFLSFLTPKVERGVGVPKRSRDRQRSKKPLVPTTSWQVATKSEPVTVPQTRVTQKKPPPARPAAKVVSVAAAEPTPTPSGTPGFGQFFSNIFGGDAAASSSATGSVKPSPPPVRTTPPAAAKPQPRPVAAPAGVAKPLQIAAARPPAPRSTAPISRSGRRGKFEIEVAKLRNIYRADALARQLVVRYSSSSFWGTKQTARVQEIAGIGDTGALYSVRYGVYDNNGDLSSTCEQFKADGLNCEVVRQN